MSDNGGSGDKTTETEKKVNAQGNLFEKQGTLLLDATCTPADIHYPTDLWLLNQAREALEEIIDVLHEPLIGQSKKPRTYRQSARKSYLNVDKKKHKTAKAIRRGIGKQLRFIKRDLKIVKNLCLSPGLPYTEIRYYNYLGRCTSKTKTPFAYYLKEPHPLYGNIQEER